MPLSLPSVVDVMTGHQPRKLLARRMLRRCAVNLLLRDDGGHDVELLMIQRAERDGDPWSGQMGFPGGRMDEVDQNIFATAMREMQASVSLPVVASDVPGLREVVGPTGDCGILVNPESAASIADALACLLDSPEARIDMGRRGFARAKRFDKAEMTKAYASLYRQLAREVPADA